MKIKKMNRTHSVCKLGIAQWVAMFDTPEGFYRGMMLMHNAFGDGRPYTGRLTDKVAPWLFRPIEVSATMAALDYHAIYLTDEEHVTLLSVSCGQDD